MDTDKHFKLKVTTLETGQLWAYLFTVSAFLLLMLVFWILGIESVYAHPAPFYALPLPATQNWAIITLALVLWGQMLLAGGTLAAPRVNYWCSESTHFAFMLLAVAAFSAVMAFLNENMIFDKELLWHLLAVATGITGVLSAQYLVMDPNFILATPNKINIRYFLFGLVVFSVLFSTTLAMLRGGTNGIAAPYMRTQLEYIGDIGVTSGIRDLFRRYNEILSYLSTHSRAAPPGPIALLWGFSYLFGNDPLALSVCTVVFGSLAVVPFYYWVREISNNQVAVIASILYVFCPGIILFTATSAEILFMPFTMATLYFFERAIRRNQSFYALLAGMSYGVMAHLKFTLIGIGAYFAIVGLRHSVTYGKRLHVVQTAIVMGATTFAFIGAIWLWSGFNIIECILQAKHHFDIDQITLDLNEPRYSGWVYRFLNPFAWFFFAGIPVSVLFLCALRRNHAYISECMTLFITLFVLNLLYMGRGEAERSALYVFPLLIPPAALVLTELIDKKGNNEALLITVSFLAIQCWAMETLLYTYW